MRGISPERSEASVPSEARASERNFSFSCVDDNTRGAAPSKFRLNMHIDSEVA